MQGQAHAQQKSCECYRQVARPYKREEHQWIADVADELAQEVRAEMVRRGYSEGDLIYDVKLLMHFASGGPKIRVDAIRFDRSYDWDADLKRAMDSPLTGYAKFSEMPGDVAFRVAGRSMGHFIGGWISFSFEHEYRKQTGETELGSELMVDAIIASARAAVPNGD